MAGKVRNHAVILIFLEKVVKSCLNSAFQAFNDSGTDCFFRIDAHQKT